MDRLALPSLAVLACAALAGCAQAPLPARPGPSASLASPFTGYESPHYKDPRSWLCLPDRDDACAANVDATELFAEGGRAIVTEPPRPGREKVDCFYVYPTVDLSLGPANHASFDDTSAIARTTLAQVGRLQNVCRLFVPLYRQATIGAYLRAPEVRDRYLDVAASDVVDAFVHYMGSFNKGHKVVLVGHSQGADMITRLLSRFFDGDSRMRELLLLGLPIGGRLEVAAGKTTGGTFANLPVCTTPGETACIVGYRSYPAGRSVGGGAAYNPSAGHESVCVNPAELDSGPGGRFARAFFPLLDETRSRMTGVESMKTPFVMLRDFYRGACTAADAKGFRYLAVSEDRRRDDTRASLFDLGSRLFAGQLGLHILDLQFAQGDIEDLIGRRAAALP